MVSVVHKDTNPITMDSTRNLQHRSSLGSIRDQQLNMLAGDATGQVTRRGTVLKDPYATGVSRMGTLLGIVMYVQTTADRF